LFIVSSQYFSNNISLCFYLILTWWLLAGHLSRARNQTGHQNKTICEKEHIEINTLKVPKREIFDRSDFPDFYTMKSLRVGDFGVKIKKKFKNI